MRKFLLLGTIFVATSALAFGGIGIGPWQRHKNQGVDAIGIHIDPNGKKADLDIIDGDSQEETCLAEKQCGIHCCQGDNVCKQDPDSGELQCCSEALDYCCPANQVAYKAPWGTVACCAGVIFCYKNDETCLAEGRWMCCPEGSTIYGPLADTGGFQCCEKGTRSMCQRWNSEGKCISYYCYATNWHRSCFDRYENGSCKNATYCPQGEEAYCKDRRSGDSDTSCNVAYCCPTDKISYGTGKNGADECL